MKPLYLNKRYCLFPVIGLLLLALLTGCASTTPYQSVSDTRQILDSANTYVTTPADEADYALAESALSSAERAIEQGDYPRAKSFLQKSRAQAQAIIDRYNQRSNIKFRY